HRAFGGGLGLGVEVEVAARIRQRLVDVELVAAVAVHHRAGAGDAHEPGGATTPGGIQEQCCRAGVLGPELVAGAALVDTGGTVHHHIPAFGGTHQRVRVGEVAVHDLHPVQRV